jgi:RNA polymerase-binding transcription factor DksA
MKTPTKKQREAARMASPYPEDRFTDKEENERYEQGYQALRRKLASDSTAGPELRGRRAPGPG